MDSEINIIVDSYETLRHHLFNKYCAKNAFCTTCPLYKERTCKLLVFDDLINELKATV